MESTTESSMSRITVRPLQAADISEADRIMRIAFGTFLGLPEPTAFMGDAAYVRPRWQANSDAAFVAEIADAVCGSNFACNWGSVGFFGPLTVRPDLWDRGLGKLLMEPIIACFDQWNTQLAGLFTFAQSEKHLGLYRKFGFWPRFLTAIMSKPVAPSTRRESWERFSELTEHRRASVLEQCRELTNPIFEGLDLTREIQAVTALKLGETILLADDGELAGFAICHYGPGTEGGSGNCYIKFGAARMGTSAAANFRRLLEACEQFASCNCLRRIVAGVNTARHESYRSMLSQGFRSDVQGVAMQRENKPGYNHPSVFVIDDWR